MNVYRDSRSRFRYLLENACLLGAAIIIWLSLIGSVVVAVTLVAGSSDSGSEIGNIFDETVPGDDPFGQDRDGYVCLESQEDELGLCPANPEFAG